MAASPALANDLANAPASIPYASSKAVFIDFQKVSTEWTFDVSSRKTTARAVVDFRVEEAGYPIFDIVPDARVKLNGIPVEMVSLNIPNVTTMRTLDVGVLNGNYTVEFEYTPNNVTYSGNVVRFGTFMGDLSDRNFFEQYGPTNLEFDHYVQSISVNVIGTEKEHDIFANGRMRSLGNNEFIIDYPEYFTTSSFYFHLMEKDRFPVERFTYQGLDKLIPVEVYASTQDLVSRAVAQTKRVMTELESTYGSYGHEKLVVYVTPSGGGMEYSGATMTSMYALGHELTHQWFARGVMPANGNSGWIDEAIASWRDEGYPRRSTGFSNAPINLSGFSEYKRFTTNLAYSSGMRFISFLDGQFADRGGMKPLLAQLWSEKRNQSITTDMFKTFLEEKTGKDLNRFFDFYVYGKRPTEELDLNMKSFTCQGFTKEEIEQFK